MHRDGVKTDWRRIVPAVSALLLGCVCALTIFTAASADADSSMYIRLAEPVGSTVGYTVCSETAYANALAITAAYKGDRLVGVRSSPISIAAGEVSGSQNFSVPFDGAKVFLIDADTYTPLCLPGKKCAVLFQSQDGTVLSSQEVLSGHAAARPDAPEKQGYIFAGWGRDTNNILDDAILSPHYISSGSANIFSISSASGAVGSEVTLSVRLSGSVSVCGFDMRLVYDGSALEYVSMDAEKAMDVLANHPAGTNSIRFNFSSSANRKTAGDILSITFRILSGMEGSSAVALQPVDVYTAADDGHTLQRADYSLAEGAVTVK